MPSIDPIVDQLPSGSDETMALDLSPSTSIHHPDILTRLRRKASLQIGPQTNKKCRLQPASIEDDRTMMQSYDRFDESGFNMEISVRMPGESIVKTLKHGKVEIIDLAATEEQNECYGERSSELESRMERLDEKISKIKEQRTALFRDIAAFSKRVHERDEARLRDCRANTLIDLVKKVFIDLKLNYPGNLDGVEDTKKTRLIKAALSLNQQQLESFFKENGKKVGPQYFKVLQNITHYLNGRYETPYETPTDFAILLSSDQYKETGEYYKWGNLFPYVYGESVAEIVEAAVETRMLKMWIGPFYKDSS